MTFSGRLLAGASLLALAMAPLASPAVAHAPLPGQAGHSGPELAPYVAPPGTSGQWQTLTNAFPGKSFPDTALLLTDGTVLMHDGCTTNWYKLTPDNTGSYTNGTWTKAGSMPKGYTPLYVASQVLPDGRLMVQGGEYLECQEAWTNLGALYDPVLDKWTPVVPPKGWATIGDAESVVLPDGTYMIANCCSETKPEAALATIKGTRVTWKTTGTNKANSYDEEGWTILPNELILTVNAWLDASQNYSGSETYSQDSGAWTPSGNTTGRIEDPSSLEVGPAVLMPNGKVFQVAANSSGTKNATSYTSIYDPVSGTWAAGPNLPTVGGKVYSAEDAPASLLPSGNVLVQLSPAYTCKSQGSLSAFCTPSHFWEFDGKQFIQVNEPKSAPKIGSFEGRMLVLPSGQIFWSSDSGDVEVYTPQGAPQKAWLPTITQVAASVSRGSTNNVVQGTMFNGLSLGASYGDDAQSSTNYPIVRLINKASGHVCYARTHDHATMGISDGGPTSTNFDVPSTCEAGKSTIQVVANGIASAAKAITVK